MGNTMCFIYKSDFSRFLIYCLIGYCWNLLFSRAIKHVNNLFLVNKYRKWGTDMWCKGKILYIVYCKECLVSPDFLEVVPRTHECLISVSIQGYGFSSRHILMWELDYKQSWSPKNWWFWTAMLEKTLESPLDCKEIQPVNPKGNQSWMFIERTVAEDEMPILWPPDAKNRLIAKDPDAGKDWRWEEKTMTEEEIARWHHWLNGHEFG